MTVIINGRFVPERRAMVSVFDRGFLYGDGVFETIRVHNGQLFCWDEHWARLERAAAFVRIKIPLKHRAARARAERLIHLNQARHAMLRVNLSRGIGVRGYSPAGAHSPTFVMTVQSLGTAAGRLQKRTAIVASMGTHSADSSVTHKTSNKLLQVLARAEAEAVGAGEALLLNERGHIAEATSGNVFWLAEGELHTPPLSAGVLPGITRLLIIRLATQRGWKVRETNGTVANLQRAKGVFISLSSLGIIEVTELDGQQLRRSLAVRELWKHYQNLLEAECSGGEGLDRSSRKGAKDGQQLAPTH